jgi:hypothetical protein
MDITCIKYFSNIFEIMMFMYCHKTIKFIIVFIFPFEICFSLVSFENFDKFISSSLIVKASYIIMLFIFKTIGDVHDVSSKFTTIFSHFKICSCIIIHIHAFVVIFLIDTQYFDIFQSNLFFFKNSVLIEIYQICLTNFPC